MDGFSNFIFFSSIVFALFTSHLVNSAIISHHKGDHHNIWSYEGDNGPDHWGEICQLGNKQSPINILTNGTKPISLSPFEFGENYEVDKIFEPVNNGHTLSVSSPETGNIPTFRGAGLEDEYAFQQFHFHWESEHEIDGERADLELHLVHYNTKYKDMGVASLKKDGLAVIAVLCDEEEDPDSVIEDFLQEALFALDEPADNATSPPPLRDTSENPIGNRMKESKPQLTYRLKDFLPEDIDTWYRYEGSLTTPPCSESVTWTIFTSRVSVSSNTLDALRSLRDKEDNEMINNFRPVQALNGRTVYLHEGDDINVIKESEESVKKGHSNVIHPNFLFVLFIAIALRCCSA